MNNRTIVDDIVWWIPFKKLRNKVRNKLYEITYSLIKNKVEYKIKKLTPKTCIEQLDIHIIENCNLSCYSCLHFGQLAEKEIKNLDDFERDIKKLYEITKGNIKIIKLLGGEPLLNKKCKDYFYITRKYFDKSTIQLTTNGVLLLEQDESFWKACRENSIEILVSRYLINLKWQDMIDKANENGIILNFTNEEFTRYNIKWTFDLNKKADPFNSFIECFASNGGCTTLKNGKIYMCCITAHIEHFNKYFNQNLEVSELDYIDIYKVNNYREILNFLSKPIPFCGYCDISKNKIVPWKTSTKDISEYI